MNQNKLNMQSTDYQTSLQLFNQIYGSLPAFADIFDEETFYIFAGIVVVSSFALAFLLSRFITLKEADW